MSKYDAFYVSAEVHERKVMLADGSEHALHFKEIPALVYRKFQMAEQSQDEDVRAGSMAKLISASLCEADGSQAMSYEEALKLKASAANALLDAVLEVNGRRPGNALPPGEQSGSGTSSPSPLAAEQ